jgi:hypothetical protein
MRAGPEYLNRDNNEIPDMLHREPPTFGSKMNIFFLSQTARPAWFIEAKHEGVPRH